MRRRDGARLRERRASNHGRAATQHPTVPSPTLLLEDHSLDIPPFLERREDGSMKYPGLPVAKPELTAAVTAFEMSPEELGRQKDRVAIQELKLTNEALKAARAQKTPEQKETDRQRRIEKQKRKEHSLQMERWKLFQKRKLSW